MASKTVACTEGVVAQEVVRGISLIRARAGEMGVMGEASRSSGESRCVGVSICTYKTVKARYPCRVQVFPLREKARACGSAGLPRS